MRRYARAEYVRKMPVAAAISGNTLHVASASRQSSVNRITAAPNSERVFETDDVRPSVTSVCSASTSFVRREIKTPARVRS